MHIQIDQGKVPDSVWGTTARPAEGVETNRGIPGTADFGRTTLGHDGHAGHPARPVCGCNSGRIEQLAGKRIWGTGTRGDKRGRPVGGIEARAIAREEGTAEFVGCESEIGTEAKLARKTLVRRPQAAAGRVPGRPDEGVWAYACHRENADSSCCSLENPQPRKM